MFSLLFGASLFADLLSNDRPLLVHHEGRWYLPLFVTYPEVSFGGDFDTPTNYLDPHVIALLDQPGSFALHPPNRYRYDSMDTFSRVPNPAPPSRSHWLGTDDGGRDVFARLLYGFRLSVLFALALTAIGTLLGVLAGAVQGYFSGWTDMLLQRLIEIWAALPELYLLIIFASIFEPGLLLLLCLLSLFGWMGLSDYVRAEFLRNRQMEYVKAARTIGQPAWRIIVRHILPNSLTPIITFVPFRISAAILALTSLDFLGLGVPPPTPSLGELLAQGKTYLEAWWISVPTVLLLVATLLMLTLIGNGIRDALDPRQAGKAQAFGAP